MKFLKYDIEIISAPSILGLKHTGVEYLSESLLASGLAENLKSIHTVIHVPTLNNLYNDKRDQETNCLNAIPIKNFSLTLGKVVSATIDKNRFAFVLGGDCSILIGIMPALKAKGTYGDFYEPEESVTGEVADMDLAIVTGRGPGILTNINELKPYVNDKNVIHIGQRDWEETKKYGSQDIQETTIKCISLADIERKGMNAIVAEVLQHINRMEVNSFWVHFDTDVLSDKINPAVDYRIAGGLLFEQVENLVRNLLLTRRIAGISVTIFNPGLDNGGQISYSIAQSLGRAFDLSGC